MYIDILCQSIKIWRSDAATESCPVIEKVTVHEGFGTATTTAATSSKVPFGCDPKGWGQAVYVLNNKATIEFTSGQDQQRETFVYRWEFFSYQQPPTRDDHETTATPGSLEPDCGTPGVTTALPTTLTYTSDLPFPDSNRRCSWKVNNIPGHVSLSEL